WVDCHCRIVRLSSLCNPRKTKGRRHQLYRWGPIQSRRRVCVVLAPILRSSGMSVWWSTANLLVGNGLKLIRNAYVQKASMSEIS
ncbi:cytochrome c oxidase copper chaperone 1, partial [Phtheirospermum japonicum]